MGTEPLPLTPTSDLAEILSSSPLEQLRQIHVWESDIEVIISGRVSSYYLKQMAQETIRLAVGDRRLLNRIEVVDRESHAPTRKKPDGLVLPMNDQTAGLSPTTSTAPSAPDEVASVTLRTYEELVRELIELEKQFPPPNESECFADARWFEERWGTAEFEPYRGTHVAVLNGTVVGHGRNSLQLRRDLVREHDIHPQRFIIVYIPTRGL